MYIKIAGFLLLLTGGTMTGAGKAATLAEREKILRSLRESVQIFQNEIEYKTETLEKAMKKASCTDKSGVFSKGVENIRKYGGAKGFELGAEHICDRNIREIMCAFGRGLSAEDKGGILKNIHLTALRLDEEIKNASETKKRLSKMYITMGFMAGAAIGIVFL